MPKPFHKLGEIFGVSPAAKFLEDPPPFKAKSWEEIIQSARPLEEKNFYFEFSPKAPKFFREKVWPPSRLEIKLSLTSEYIEGKKPWVSEELLYRLREGKFSVQATLNLRGLTVEEAKVALDDFLRKALQKGLRCVLIIHGRGLASKGEPVLKHLVKSWCERGPYRKYILAYASARACDGGLGATYLLLSEKPLKR